MDAVFDSDDGGAKSRQLLESREAVQLLLNRCFHCASELLIGYHRHGELEPFEPTKNSRWDCEKGFYSVLRAKRAREGFRTPLDRKDPILDNAEYLGALSGPWSVYISRLKKEKG